MASRLVDPELGTLELSPVNGYAVKEIDLGYPAAREASVERVNTNGTDDATAFYGARAVSLVVSVWPGPVRTANRRAALDRLRAFTSPARRPALFFNDDDLAGEPDRMLRLRGDQFGSSLTNPILSTVQVQWVAPAGIIESAAEQMVTVPAVPDSGAGRRYPRTYPIVYPQISAVGSVAATDEGTEPAAPVLRLWGPCTDPWIVNLASGEVLSLSGMSLTADQYVEVDVREATVRLQGRADQNVYTTLTLASALWWLRPGVNRIRYTPASFGPTARADVVWRHAWI